MASTKPNFGVAFVAAARLLGGQFFSLSEIIMVNSSLQRFIVFGAGHVLTCASLNSKSRIPVSTSSEATPWNLKTW